MMMDWEDYRKQLLATIQQIGQASPDIVRGYRTIADGAAKIGKLEPKVRELISLAVAVTARCDGCIVTHVDGHLGERGCGVGLLRPYAGRLRVAHERRW